MNWHIPLKSVPDFAVHIRWLRNLQLRKDETFKKEAGTNYYKNILIRSGLTRLHKETIPANVKQLKRWSAYCSST